MRARARSLVPPAPLGALLFVVLIAGLCWAMVMPPFQSPDAFTHWSYVESLATRFALPGRPGHNEESSNVLAAYRAAGVLHLQWSSPEVKPSWSTGDAAAYRVVAARLSRADGAGPTPAQSYPPFYYGFATLPYLATIGGDTLDRLLSVQLAGVLLLLATTVAAWALAGEVFGPRRLLQLTTAAVVALAPMSAFITTSVNPDALLITLWTVWLWLGARVIVRGGRGRDVIAMAAVTVAASLTKSTGYAMLPAFVVAMTLAAWSRARARRPHWRTAGLLAAAALVVYAPIQAWVSGLHANGRPTLSAYPADPRRPAFLSHLIDYLWQFYLPRLGRMPVFRVPTLRSLPWPRQLPGLPLWNVWVRQGWGVFGWLDVYMPAWVYVLLGAVTAAVAIGAAALSTRLRAPRRFALLTFFGVSLLSLLAVLHEVEFTLLTSGGGAFNQGRYLLPEIALFGLAVSLAVSRLPARARGPVAAVLMAGLVGLQVLALATVARTYYT